MAVIRLLVGSVKGHGYKVIEYHKDGRRTMIVTVPKGETKLRMKRGTGWELYISSGWNLNSRCSLLTEDVARSFLKGWGF